MPFLATKVTFPGKEFFALTAPLFGPRDVKPRSSGRQGLVLGRTDLCPREDRPLSSGGPFLFLFMLLFSAQEDFRQMKLVCVHFFL
jgi:hypothetical protein